LSKGVAVPSSLWKRKNSGLGGAKAGKEKGKGSNSLSAKRGGGKGKIELERGKKKYEGQQIFALP